ncbi:MAG: D-arabinono-1,4-lactone oxidase [Anaerolineae bacterium]
MHHTVKRQIVAFRVVDGTSKIHEYRRSDDLDSLFYALGVSMGLLGIITAVTFQCVDRFDVAGIETTSSLENCAIDLFGNGYGEHAGLETFFSTVDYSRVLWFPQPGVDKVIVWQANQVPATKDPTYKPYREFPAILGSELPAQVLASVLFCIFDVLNPQAPHGSISKAFEPLLKPLYPAVVNTFLASAVLGPQHFSDTWWRGIPMDDRVNYNLLPTRFTELWLPLSKTAEVMSDLRAHYHDNGYRAITTYACEFYATLANDFWLSPAYQQDSFRVDPFWFAPNRGDPDTVYFPQYWELLRKYNYRLHWGKSPLGDVEYLKVQYPRWDDFTHLRNQMDPHQIFVTDYWRQHLGIAQSV